MLTTVLLIRSGMATLAILLLTSKSDNFFPLMVALNEFSALPRCVLLTWMQSVDALLWQWDDAYEKLLTAETRYEASGCKKRPTKRAECCGGPGVLSASHHQLIYKLALKMSPGGYKHCIVCPSATRHYTVGKIGTSLNCGILSSIRGMLRGYEVFESRACRVQSGQH